MIIINQSSHATQSFMHLGWSVKKDKAQGSSSSLGGSNTSENIMNWNETKDMKRRWENDLMNKVTNGYEKWKIKKLSINENGLVWYESESFLYEMEEKPNG